MWHAVIRYCDAEATTSESGLLYSWPRTLAGGTVTLTCPTSPNVVVMRNCSIEGLWQNAADDGCDSVSEQLDMLNPAFTNVSRSHVHYTCTQNSYQASDHQNYRTRSIWLISVFFLIAIKGLARHLI